MVDPAPSPNTTAQPLPRIVILAGIICGLSGTASVLGALRALAWDLPTRLLIITVGLAIASGIACWTSIDRWRAARRTADRNEQWLLRLHTQQAQVQSEHQQLAIGLGQIANQLAELRAAVDAQQKLIGDYYGGFAAGYDLGHRASSPADDNVITLPQQHHLPRLPLGSRVSGHD